jgi:TatD DNase family protein
LHPVTFIDIHTHRSVSEPGTMAIRNMRSDFSRIPSQGSYSVGLHPWYLEADQAEHLPVELLRAAGLRNVVAIGECGLDTRCDTPADLQRAVFIRQIELAQAVQKPLIIHSVRAFEEILTILRKRKVSVPVMFHGFRRSEALARKIIDDGHLLSFGVHLLMASVAEVFRNLPPNRVFLETDDSEVPISHIYAAAANIWGTDIEGVAAGIEHQFKLIFGPVTDLI